ncbi:MULTISPECIES: helix-turn-helix domain-containing protein [unclassified Bradyrhizobium]
MHTDASRPVIQAASTPHRLGSPAMQGPLALMGTRFQYARNAEIYGEGDEAEYLYQVVSGTVRTYKVLEDGRRQIGGFYLPGDIFGFEAGETHSSSAEAVNGAQVLIVKRSAVMLRAEREKDLSQQLWDATTRELQRFRNHMLLLIKTAEERVAGFLLDIARRTASTNSVELAMSRQDIADYLGLTIETVSRTFTQLEQSGAITLATSRRIELRNRAALNRLNA